MVQPVTSAGINPNEFAYDTSILDQTSRMLYESSFSNDGGEFSGVNSSSGSNYSSGNSPSLFQETSRAPLLAYQRSSHQLGQKTSGLLDNLSMKTLNEALKNPKQFKAERKELTLQVYKDLKAAGVTRKDGKELRLKDVEKAQKKAGDAAEKVMKDAQKAEKKILKAEKKIAEAKRKGKAPEAKHLAIVNNAELRAKAEGGFQNGGIAFTKTLASRLGISVEQAVEVYGDKRLDFLHAVETGRAFKRGGFFSSFLGKVVKIGAIVAGGVVGGPVGAAIAAGGISVIEGAAEGYSLGKIALNAGLSAGLAYGGGQLSSFVGSKIAGSATKAAVSPTTKYLGKVAGDAASGFAKGTFNTLRHGGDFGKALENGFVSGLTAGAGSAGAGKLFSDAVGLKSGSVGDKVVEAAVPRVASSTIPYVLYGRGNPGSIAMSGLEAAGQAYLRTDNPFGFIKA